MFLQNKSQKHLAKLVPGCLIQEKWQESFMFWPKSVDLPFLGPGKVTSLKSNDGIYHRHHRHHRFTYTIVTMSNDGLTMVFLFIYLSIYHHRHTIVWHRDDGVCKTMVTMVYVKRWCMPNDGFHHRLAIKIWIPNSENAIKINMTSIYLSIYLFI